MPKQAHIQGRCQPEDLVMLDCFRRRRNLGSRIQALKFLISEAYNKEFNKIDPMAIAKSMGIKVNAEPEQQEA